MGGLGATACHVTCVVVAAAFLIALFRIRFRDVIALDWCFSLLGVEDIKFQVQDAICLGMGRMRN